MNRNHNTLSALNEDPSPIFTEIFSENYSVRIADSPEELHSALRLRYEVFNLEIAGEKPVEGAEMIESDEFDLLCRHLIVVERSSGKTVGTYRLNTLENAVDVSNFYSFGEFTIEDLPLEVLENAVEIGRACIAADHRNTKVLFLLWKGLASFLKVTKKRYLFGCCSVFSTDSVVGENTYKYLVKHGLLHRAWRVDPRRNLESVEFPSKSLNLPVELPMLFNMYLKIGARVCGKPAVDHDFGTLDFFVIFDLESLTGRYRQMFSAE